MQLFYNPHITDHDSFFNFDKEESQHIVKVLRKRVGDRLHITNGKGWLFNAELSLADRKHCSATISTKTFTPLRDYKLHLAVAPTKMNDRFEWFLEKATEIGISTITPIICDHSERKVIKEGRFKKILQSAMKQSLQHYLPELRPAISFKDFIAQDLSGQRFIAHCEDTDRKSLKSQLKTKADCNILIGPEGDFSIKEVELALQKRFVAVTLGETRLRTETAAVAACHSFAYANEL
jgi:16S rRNA (uracil1498-N3)-methyltransferase